MPVWGGCCCCVPQVTDTPNLTYPFLSGKTRGVLTIHQKAQKLFLFHSISKEKFSLVTKTMRLDQDGGQGQDRHVH